MMHRILTISLSLFVAKSLAASKPNVLFIVADDLGWSDIGIRDNDQINTVNLDAMAEDGIILNQYYVQCVCSPSRAVFQTGRYPVHNTIYDWIHPDATFGLPLNETTLGDKFKEAGYVTRAIGKWHLGFFQSEYTPTYRGYDSFLGFYSGGEDYFKHTSSGAYDFRRDDSPNCGLDCSKVDSDDNGKYSTNVFAEEAVSVINDHDVSQPLFMYLAFQAVHAPGEVPESYVAPYVGKIENAERRTFAGMLSAMDEGIGNVTAALKAKGMMDNTLIVFTSDNGGPTTTGDGVGSRNFPLRGGKHTIWEGGTRVTAFLHGKMLPKTGYEYQGLMHGADWLPTLVTAAGLTPGGTLPLDGMDMWEAVTTNATSPRNEIFYGNNDDNTPQSWGIRIGDWKLLMFGGGNPDTWWPPVNSSAPLTLEGTLAKEANTTCSVAQATAYPGNDITSKMLSSSDDCCALCHQTTGCVAWTYNTLAACTKEGEPTVKVDAGGCCFVKEKIGTPEGDVNAVSGSISPNPPTPPNMWQLYNLVSDPYEHHDVSAQNPDVVAKLKTRLLEIYDARVPLVPDGNCPKLVHPTDPTVGPVWAPWCDGH